MSTREAIQAANIDPATKKVLEAVFGATIGTVVTETLSGAATGVYQSAQKGVATAPAAFGSSTFTDPSAAYGTQGHIIGANLTGDSNYVAGTVGVYRVTGTNASLYPKAGVLGVIGDLTTTADAAVVALLDGDTGTTTARAAFGVAMVNSTAASGFDYGADLLIQAISGHTSSQQPYKVAQIRLGLDADDTDVVIVIAEFTDGDSTTLGNGSLIIDNASAAGKLGVVINGAIQTVTT